LKRLTYDLGVQNKAKLVLESGEYGKIALYEQGALEVNGPSTVDLITDCGNLKGWGLISINDKATVKELYLTGDSGNKSYSTVYSIVRIAAGATVENLIITKYVMNDDSNLRDIEIAAGAKINNIVFDGKSYTSSEFTFSTDRKTITFTKDGSSIDFVIDNVN